MLGKRFPEKAFRVINAGIPGFDTSQSIPNLALRVMPFMPDIVIIYHAYNDLKAIDKDRIFRPDYSHIHTRPYGFYKEPSLLTKMLNKSMFYVRTRNRARENDKILEGKNDAEESVSKVKKLSSIPEIAKQTFQQHVRVLVNIARAGGSKVILSTFATLNDPSMDYSKQENFQSLTESQKKGLANLPHFTPGLTLEGIFHGFDSYNEILRNVAIEENCMLVDNARAVPHEDRYFVDRVHFSESGAELMANNLYPHIVQLLKEKQLVE